VAIPSIVWGPAIGLGVYLAVFALVGVFLALVFAPAHIGLPVVEHQHHDWLHQLETTRNLELPRVISFFFIGLDYQVEHHLFPKIPHANLPRAAEITAAWCKRHGVIYQTMPYLDALADAVRFMKDAWRREASTADAIRMAS
jgi:fatty acid desaturase